MIRFICLLIMPFFIFAGNSKFPWVVYYGENNINTSKLFPFNPIVLDSNNPPPIQELLDKKKDVLGYLAITEIPESDSEYLEALEKKLLIEENPNFLKSWSVDIRNPLWKKIVLKKKIPKILGKGFNGFFLDQVDVALALEIKNPKKYAGMKDAAIDLIKSIKESFPDKKIMVNRGYEIIKNVGNFVDYILAETLYTSYSFKEKKYFVRPEKEFEWQLNQIKIAKDKFPKIIFFSLDYWNPNDMKMYKKIYSIERKHGLRPYVSTIELDEIIIEP